MAGQSPTCENCGGTEPHRDDSHARARIRHVDFLFILRSMYDAQLMCRQRISRMSRITGWVDRYFPN